VVIGQALHVNRTFKMIKRDLPERSGKSSTPHPEHHPPAITSHAFEHKPFRIPSDLLGLLQSSSANSAASL